MSVNFLLKFTAQARTVRNLKSGAGTVATHSAEVLYVYAAFVCVYIYQHIDTFPSSDTVCTYGKYLISHIPQLVTDGSERSVRQGDMVRAVPGSGYH
jgi:hypothetical protein